MSTPTNVPQTDITMYQPTNQYLGKDYEAPVDFQAHFANLNALLTTGDHAMIAHNMDRAALYYAKAVSYAQEHIHPGLDIATYVGTRSPSLVSFIKQFQGVDKES